MPPVTRFTIGIQARSKGTRFPGKIFQQIGSKSALDHLIDSCLGCAHYLNRYGDKNRMFVEVALCVPEQDPLVSQYQDQVFVVQGPEQDVLARYANLVQALGSDFVVRVTGDCPLLPSFIIQKHIVTAFANHYDYFSNVDERCRTSADGMDCEVISRRLLTYLLETAKDPADREHVTRFIRKNPPPWIRQGAIINFLDLSHYKLSLDTPEDLERIRGEHQKISEALDRAQAIYGAKNVHRL